MNQNLRLIHHLYLVCLVFVSGIILMVDYLVPNGIAVGSLYIIPVISTIFLFTSRRSLYLLVIVNSALIVGGFFLGTGMIDPYAVMIDRGISLGVIWSSAFLCHFLILNRRSRVEHNKRFEQVLQAAPNGMLIVDPYGKIVMANRQMESMFGYTGEELEGVPVEQLVPRRFQGRHPEYRQAYTRNPVPRTMGANRDLYGLRKDGSEFPVEIGLRPIQMEKETLIIGSVIDITERKKVEWELQRLKEQFESALQAAPNGMILVDQLGKMVFANHQAESMFGYSSGELADGSIEKLVPRKYQATHPKLRNDYLFNPKPRRMGMGRDLYGLRKDGSEFPIEIGLNPITTDRGFLIISSIIDITERKAAEIRLKERTEELARAYEELDSFSCIAGHDVKEPLRGIQNLSLFLREDYGNTLEKEAVEKLERMDSLCMKLQGRVDRLLEYSRIGRTKLRRESISLKEIMDDVVESLGDLITVNHVKLEVASPQTLLRVDKLLFVEVLSNLVSNAIKYNEAPEKKVEVGVENDELYVRDNGIGIHSSHHERVFQIFKRLHREEAYEGGTGAGLSIVKKIVEQHGEGIRLESEPGQGTVFFLSLNHSLS